MKELDYLKIYWGKLPPKQQGFIIEVFEAIDQRLNDKADKQVANDNVKRDMEYHRALGKRITALETQAIPFDGWFENLHKRMSHQECPSPLLLDLVQRVCALDGGSDYEVHERKPYSCCEGCAKKGECGHNPVWVGLGCVHPKCYREKKTCGECRYPWSREHFGRPEQWVLVCDRVHEEETVGTELERVTRSRKACPNFEASC